MLLLEVFGWAL